MKRGWWVLSSLILVGTLLAVLFINYQQPKEDSLPLNILDPLTQSSRNAVGQFRNRITPLESEVNSIRSSLSSIWSQRTPTPGINAFNQQIVSAVRQADSRRENQLQQIHSQLGQVGSQLRHLQQRATALDVRIQDSVRSVNDRMTQFTANKSKGQDSLQLVVILIGLSGSLSTMLLAWRKDSREEKDEKRKAEKAT